MGERTGEFMTDLIKKIADKEMNRRDFLKTSAVGAAMLSFIGSGGALTQVANAAEADAVVNGEGKWIPAACWYNCGGRCYNAAYVVDNVVVRQKTDDTHPDSPDFPQQRGCLRGRSMRTQVFGADRIKYPMKRKHWEPGGGDKSLRGKDEWERISWDEALDYVAVEMETAKEKYGNRSILVPSWGQYIDDYLRLLCLCGGYTTITDTASFGTYGWDVMRLGILPMDMNSANDRFDLKKSETIVLYGCNPAWSSLGSPSYHFWQAKKAGAKYVFVGPGYNDSADLLDAKWIRVRPGTDTAFLLSVAYVMITEDDQETNPIIDWDFLNRCTVGFDADHMPADAKLNENFKDYVLGKYDGQPKTPEWATEITGTPVEDILWYAREMRKDKRVSILHSFAAARCNNADDFPQLFMTIGAMGGHMGKSGHSCGVCYHAQSSNNGQSLVTAGSTGIGNQQNPVDDSIYGPVVWESILNEKYDFIGDYLMGSGASAPRESRNIDIRVIFHGTRNALQTIPGITKGIEAHRKVDFVVSCSYSLDASAQYADIVLPISTQWERHSSYGMLSSGNREILFLPSQVTEPLYEAKDDQWICAELAKRLGVDITVAFPFDEKQQYFNLIATSTVIKDDGTTYEPLATITAQDISEWGVEGTPQQGRIALKELMEQGIYQVERYEGDPYGSIAYKAFREDPETNRLHSNSGKLEIYCQAKADIINGMGFLTLKPYPSYIPALNGYEQSFSDWENKVKGDYPYQITNPHYPRRGHTTFDNVPWVREAMHNPVFINAHDAAEKGIRDGDTVLIYSKYGKVLRQASVSQQLMPGYIELPHGTWTDIDEETGIDNAGSDNILCAPETTGCGVSGYNTNLVNFEKYNGEPLEADYLKPLRIINI